MKRVIKAILIGTGVGLILSGLYGYFTKEEYVETTEKSSSKKAFCEEFQPEYFNGKVSYYDNSYCEKHNPSCLTASGEVFDEDFLTCACDYKYPLNTKFRFHYQGKSVVVRCNDRGGFEKYGRVADLSKAAFKELASTRKGTLEVTFEIVRQEYEAFSRYRENHGLPKLNRSEELEKSAYTRAKAIATKEDEWSHEGYQATISAYYDNWRSIGENLARAFDGFEDALSAWHVSKKHKEILQSEKYCEVGIGHYGDIWVIHFGRQW